MCSNIWLIHFIHSFWRLFKTLLLRGAPSPVTAKEEGLEGDVKFGRGGHEQKTQLNRADWPTSEKALRCIIAKRARETIPRSRTEHPTRCQNRHWAAEITKVRGGTAKDTPGDERSNTIMYPLRDRQPM